MGLLADLLQGLKDLEECKIPKPRPQTSDDKALMFTTRTETDGKLQVFDGILPADLHGIFYVVYPVGSVNSGGLPFPETINGSYNSEYASPLMNGDGMILSISFDGSQAPAIKSRLIKPPCFFADYNTRDASPASSKKGGTDLSNFKFLNFGISRMSMFLGARNLLNTAVIPVRFNDSDPFLLSTYDVGRPFIMDPLKLTLQSPLGASTDWMPATPSFLNWPFPVVQTTAHPSFDPATQELFSVNYCKASTAKEYLITQRTAHYLTTDKELFKGKLKLFCEKMLGETDAGKIADSLMSFFENLDFHMTGQVQKEMSTASADTSVWLMKWKGEEIIEKWTLTDQQGNALQIQECMHQTALTKDYIVLTQTAFKFSLDLLINNPFPNEPCIDWLIRQCLASAMLPYTDCYIVNRSDLKTGAGKVTAYKLQMPSISALSSALPIPSTDTTHPIPVETIHYSCDYQNPDGIITLYAIHNSSSCVAEWIRPYDTAQISGQPVDNNLMGMFALGSMDVNRIGKWVIDFKTLTVDNANSKQYYSPGKIPAKNISIANNRNADIGANTWTLGLYTFRDIISPFKPVDKIKYIWYIANGMDPDYLTEFIYEMYKNCADRILPVDDVMAYTKAGIPQTLIRLNCDAMQPDDYFQFAYGTYVRSTQFIPRPLATAGVEYELDGYLFCTMQVPIDPVNYRSEYWVFDATKISSGPVCKLFFNGIQFCFTLHSAWMESAKAYTFNYDVDVRTDYNAEITGIFSSNPTMKASMLAFFEKYVYADWYQNKKE
jgi:carotenoid cleavage dioxygenase-like enzyme